ncbi:MAG: hypothetical protein ACKV2T_27240 [Kofleriaceae bacterium]
MCAADWRVVHRGGTVERWRIRPIGNRLHLETSSDGNPRDNVAIVGGVPSGTALVRVVGTPIAEPTPGTGRFESVNLCPP